MNNKKGHLSEVFDIDGNPSKIMNFGFLFEFRNLDCSKTFLIPIFTGSSVSPYVVYGKPQYGARNFFSKTS